MIRAARTCVPPAGHAHQHTWEGALAEEAAGTVVRHGRVLVANRSVQWLVNG